MKKRNLSINLITFGAVILTLGVLLLVIGFSLSLYGKAIGLTLTIASAYTILIGLVVTAFSTY